MENFGVQTLVLTVLYMERINLITKETEKRAYEGKLILDFEEKNKYYYRTLLHGLKEQHMYTGTDSQMGSTRFWYNQFLSL